MEEFIGRFHPVWVHLPIGFLLLAVLFEWMTYRFRSWQPRLAPAIPLALLLGSIAALFSIITGWLLSQSGGYTGSTLGWHKWMGIAVFVISTVFYAAKKSWLFIPDHLQRFGLLGLGVLLMITGHLGGNLTHGANYLTEHAPNWIKKIWVGNSEDGQQSQIPEHPDSILVFQDLIMPALEDQCISCHNPEKTKGDLDLTSYDAMIKSKTEDPTLVSQKPYESGLFLRTTLPASSSKRMPPQGPPLDYDALKLLEWWISNGGSDTLTVAQANVTPEVEWILKHRYQRSVTPLPFYMTEVVDSLTLEEINQIKSIGFRVNPLFYGSAYIELSTQKSIPVDSLKVILLAKQQILKLDIGGTAIQDNALSVIGQLENLTFLNLSNTEITDTGLTHLENLHRLEVLNLYGTEISEWGLNEILQLPKLKKVYLWNTAVTPSELESFQKKYENIEFIDR